MKVTGCHFGRYWAIIGGFTLITEHEYLTAYAHHVPQPGRHVHRRTRQGATALPNSGKTVGKIWAKQEEQNYV